MNQKDKSVEYIEPLTNQEMHDLDVLPIMFIGHYEVSKFPCQANDGYERQDMCGEESYAVHVIQTPFGDVRIALCKRHWAYAMRETYKPVLL